MKIEPPTVAARSQRSTAACIVVAVSVSACVGTPSSETSGVVGSVVVGTRRVMAEVQPVNGEVRLASNNLMELLKPLAATQIALSAEASTLQCRLGMAAATSIQFSGMRLPVAPTLPGADGPVPNAFLVAEQPASVVPIMTLADYPLAALTQFPTARVLSMSLSNTLRSGTGLGVAAAQIDPINLDAARTALGRRGSNVMACAQNGLNPRLDVELCLDREWPTADRPSNSTEFPTSCGPVGWAVASGGASIPGAPILRIPWRVRLSNLALNAFLSCDRRFTPEPDSLSAQICPALRDTCFGNSRIFATVGPQSTTQPIELVLETNLTPVRCSRDGTGGAPRCPEFAGSALSVETPINAPGIALVPSVAISSIRPVRADGTLGTPLSFVRLSAQSFEPGIGCRDLAEPLLNALAGVVVPILEPFFLNLLSAPLTNMLMGTVDNPGILRGAFPAPQMGATVRISPPTCQVIASPPQTIGANPSCLQEWIEYAMQRSAYRYITGPFNGPEGNNPLQPSWQWRTWRIDTSRSADQRRDLIVEVARGSGNPALLACAPGAPTNPALSGATDIDGDGIPDNCDNCPSIPNRSQHNCNQETELNLGRDIPGVSALGDACDPNPCATLGPTSVGTNARLDGEHTGSAWFGRITTHPTIGSTTASTPPDSASLTEVTALRRCGCGSIDRTGMWTSDRSTARCIADRCRRDGVVGRADSNAGFQLTDFRLRRSPCVRRARDGRCDVRENETYLPEVTQTTVAHGRVGRERDNSTSYEWDYKGEYLRGALFDGNELFTEEQNRARYIRGASMFLWTRADRREGTTTPERLRDHYSPVSDPVSVSLGAPVFAGFERLGLNECLLVPRLCSRIPLGRLRGIANFVAPRPPFGQPKLHRFVTAVALDQSELALYPWLDGDRGDLAPNVGALAVGVYDAESAQFTALGPSVGDVPPFDGTAFAFGTGADGEPTAFAFGGRNSLGISPFVYEGRIEVSENGALTRWTKYALPTNGDVALSGPLPRTDSAAAASPDGRSIFIYGGSASFGALHDAWRYNLADHTWEQVALPVRPMGSARAAIAVSDDWLVIAGGLDDNDVASPQLTAVLRGTNHSAQWSLSTGSTIDARIAIDHNRVWLYGGSATQAASDQLVEFSLDSGSVLRSIATGVASSAGAGLGVDPDGTLSILPIGQQSAVARDVVLIGTPDRLIALGERTDAGSSTCGSTASARLGLPCQLPSATSTLGTIACSESEARCVGSRETSPSTTLEGTTFALDDDYLAVAQREHIRLVSRSAPDVVLGQASDRTAVRSLALTSSWLLSTNGRSIQWRSLRSSSLPIAGELPSCGELYNLRVVDNTLYADSSFGVERFRIEATGVRRWPDHVFASALEDDESNARAVHSMDERGLSLCGALSTFFRVPLERLRSRRSFDVTSDGTLWIAQGSRLFAMQQRQDGRLSIAATRRLASDTSSVRAVGTQLAVIGNEGSRARETFELVAGENGRSSIRALGAHDLDAWIVRRPEQANSTLVQRVGERIEIRNVH
ncbi:MAG: kelch repeat-containing protein [Polyangiales bacterium]